MSSVKARDIITPTTAVLFAVSTVTGVMLLLHWNGSLVRAGHEWLSIGFSAIAAWHLAKNWRGFMSYLRRRAPLVVFAAAIIGSLAFIGTTGTTAHVSPGAVFRGLAEAPIGAAAPAFGLELAQA